MAEIVIASGKGGVGKSTLSSSLSVLLSEKKIAIVDADAEAPNLHLIFNVNSWEKEIEYREKSIATIDYSGCIQCFLCQEVCTYEAISKENNFPKIKEFLCEGCGACKVICPRKVISIKKNNLSGWIKIGKTKYGPFVSSELDVGQPNSGKLVTEEKNIARSWLKDGLVKNIIVDSAAGIGCQVIASMSGASHAILIAEPTKSSLSDLKRAFYLAEHFRIKSYIVVNKYNLNENFHEIDDFARQNDLEIIGRIPYDKNVAKSMVQRKTLIEFSPESEASKAIKEIANIVETFMD
ncbi:MAG: ATP-binding protein [Thermoplasmata archaeon]|nr:ATP-binding protein [Thermoplasmata archaeon]